jgi:hypothetical protein
VLALFRFAPNDRGMDLKIRTHRVTLALAALACVAFAAASPAAAPRDGAHDFDWETGTWATEVRVLRNPLTGHAPDWTAYRGSSVIKPLSGGRANAVELDVANPKGKIVGVSLRLYNPATGQWSLNFASYRDGMLTAPVYGGFDGKGGGLFYGQDMVDGRAVLVRFIITRVSEGEARFDQAYSTDGGRTWEDNWHAVDRRR